jgi:hypothetical protein
VAPAQPGWGHLMLEAAPHGLGRHLSTPRFWDSIRSVRLMVRASISPAATGRQSANVARTAHGPRSPPPTSNAGGRFWIVSGRFKITARFLAFTMVANHVILYPALLSHFPDERASVPGPQPFLPVRLGFPVWPPQLAASSLSTSRPAPGDCCALAATATRPRFQATLLARAFDPGAGGASALG